MDSHELDIFGRFFELMGEVANKTAKDHGFWERDPSEAEMLALVHSEISECLEALRRKNPADNKIPKFSGAEAELADAVIRIADLAHEKGWRVGQAIAAKMAYNETRPYKHGKEF